MGNNAVLPGDLNIDETTQIIEAIRAGCVDAFVVEEREGHTVYTLHNADLPYSTLVQRMQQGAVMLNTAGEVIYCNVSLSVLLGTSVDTLVGTRMQDLVHADDRKVLQQLLETLQHEASDGEVRLLRPDGKPLWVRLSLNPLMRDGSIIGVLVTDLTTEKSYTELTARIQRVQDEERRNIARELHDSVGQLLSAVIMNLNALQNGASNLSAAQSKLIEDSALMVGEVSKEIRTVSHLLHPPLLGLAGLCSAIRWYVDGFSERSHISVQLDMPSNLGSVSPEIEIALFRVVQESLTNVYRHSGCDCCAIKLQAEQDWLRLEIRDEGKGMPKNSESAESSGVGLRGMRERVRHLGGTLDVDSSGKGTAVIAMVPLHGPATRESRPSV